MELNDARKEAKILLMAILEKQPNFLVQALHQHHANGKEAAQVCSNFIETYAAYLTSRNP